MKTTITTYTISPDDVSSIKLDTKKEYKELTSLGHTEVSANKYAGIAAMFKQLERDGIAILSAEEDTLCDIVDHLGDTYNPEVNPTIPKEELARQERNERARFKRQGVFYMTLTVLGTETDSSIGGFVGKDFYHSGYDIDYYVNALSVVKERLPAYYVELTNALSGE